MSDTIDSGQEDGLSAQARAFQSIKPMLKGKPNQIQLTFNDFKNVTLTKSPEDMLKHANELLEQSKRRRSRRVVPKRSLDEEEEEPPKRQVKKKRKPVKKSKESNIDKEAVRERVKKQQQNPVQETAEPLLTEQSWSPNVPLMSLDFKTHHSVVSRFKSSNMKTVPYGNDVIRIMSFINKFTKFLPRELWGLSFQDFEVGLNLYPEVEKGTTEPLYQDYLLIKDVVSCQDNMNLLFLSLLKLVLNNNSPTTMSSLRNTSRPYAKFIAQLRPNVWAWGYPREWRKDPSSGLPKENFKRFSEDDVEPVDPKHPEILTPNLYMWPQQSPIDQDPLDTPELDKTGILALSPNDRIIMLRILTQWCLAQSDKIHSEIFRLSHFKRDPPFGVSTLHVPLLLAEGESACKAKFKRLCELLATKLRMKSKKKHVKKQLESGNRESLSHKLKVLNSIQQDMKNIVLEKENGTSIVDELDVSIDRDFDKWCDVVKGEVPDHPMESPFNDEIYKLRSLEFFIGRVPHVGDFYLPRLFTYQSEKNSNIPSTYTDPRSLNHLFDSFASEEIDAFTLFGKNGKMMSVQFKLFYHDTPSMIRDVANQVNTKSKTYWYEMCHNCETLQQFINLLEYKLGLVENTDADVSNNKSAVNKNPLPKETKYNASREKLRLLKDYLTRLYFVLEKFEELGLKYGDMEATDRTLRRSQRNKVNYVDGQEEDYEIEDEYVLEDDQSESSEDNYQEDDDDLSKDTEQEPPIPTKKRGRGRPRKRT